MRKTTRVALLTVAVLLGAADPFGWSLRATAARPSRQADGMVGTGRVAERPSLREATGGTR